MPDIELNEESVSQALTRVMDPELGNDLVSLNMIKSTVIDNGKVDVTVELTTAGCPLKAKIEQDCVDSIKSISSVKEVKIHFTSRPIPLRTEVQLPSVKKIIAISSGKGGVGKSTIAINIARAFKEAGFEVGLLDADIYGPSQPRMMGLSGQRPTTRDGKSFEPPSSHGVKVMSIGFLIDEEQPMVWRGPMVTQALTQLLGETRWETLDYLIVDMPPGTGDIQLTLAQRVPLSGAIVVTTPQEIALLDARKGLMMFRKVEVPVLGVVENMSVHVCPACGHESHVFGAGGGEAMAARYQVPLLGELPLDLRIREQADAGIPTVIGDPDSAAARAYMSVARKAAAQLALASIRGAGVFPKISVEDDE